VPTDAVEGRLKLVIAKNGLGRRGKAEVALAIH